MAGDRDKAKGKLDEVKGNVKEGVGKLTGDDDLRDEGHRDQVKGKGRQAAGTVKDAAEDVGDAVKEVFDRDKGDD